MSKEVQSEYEGTIQSSKFGKFDFKIKGKSSIAVRGLLKEANKDGKIKIKRKKK